MKPKSKKLEILIVLISIIIVQIESSALMFEANSCDGDDSAITDLFEQIQECFSAKIDLNKQIEQQNEEIAKMKADILTKMKEENANLMEIITKQNEKTEAIYNMMRELIEKQKLNDQNEELLLQVEKLKVEKSESDNYNENNQKLLSQIEEMKLQRSKSEVTVNNYKKENEKLLSEVQEQQKQVAQLQENEKKCKEKNEKLETKQKALIKPFEDLNEEISQNKPIVIQRRIDGSVDFARTWHEYQMGFGNSSSEFFIGLETLHRLTNNRSYTLRIEMEDWKHDRRYAEYNHFVIGSNSEKYKLISLGQYSGNAGDSLEYHLGAKFSTKDQDNDSYSIRHCSLEYGGSAGWWFNACAISNLNGPYKKDGGWSTDIGKVILWEKFNGLHHSLKFVEMTLRPN